ncbi:hypothetical protein Trydic_g9382 [Trypoxylus dichotomus]
MQISIPSKECILSLDVKNIILNWNSTFSPTYKIRIFQLDRQNNQRTVDEYPVESTIVKDESLALVVIPRPDFCHKLVFSVNAILLYAPASSEESQQIGLPVLEMDFKDIGDASFEVAYSDVLQRDTNSFLTCFVAREVFDLVAKIDHAENFETAISVKCGCEQIDLKSVKKLFWIRNTNVELEGNLIEVLQKEDNIFELKIIAQNEDILFQILHHLYKKIDGLCIVPKSHEIYLHHQGNSESNTQNFAEKLRKQLELFEEFHKNEIRRCSRANYLKFRAELDKLQLETDLLYLKCYPSIPFSNVRNMKKFALISQKVQIVDCSFLLMKFVIHPYQLNSQEVENNCAIAPPGTRPGVSITGNSSCKIN